MKLSLLIICIFILLIIIIFIKKKNYENFKTSIRKKKPKIL